MTVTNYTSRTARHSSTLVNNPDKDIIAVSPPERTDSQPTISSIPVRSVDKTARSKESPFIPDLDDDMNSAPADSSITLVQHSVVGAGEQDPDIDIVVDTSRASWNKPNTGPRSSSSMASVFSETNEGNDTGDDDLHPSPKHSRLTLNMSSRIRKGSTKFLAGFTSDRSQSVDQVHSVVNDKPAEENPSDDVDDVDSQVTRRFERRSCGSCS